MKSNPDLKPRVLILGGSGMLGYSFVKEICSRSDLEAFIHTRTEKKITSGSLTRQISSGDLTLPGLIDQLFQDVRPQVIINCAGLIKQKVLSWERSEESENSVLINSWLPHRLNSLSRCYGARLIHISTDCVFDGKRGNYSEDDIPTPIDLYGRSKLLGEVLTDNSVTLRTSLIGHAVDPESGVGLMDWACRQTGYIQGYKNVYFTGLPTDLVAQYVLQHVAFNNDLTGIFHLAGPKISKFDLLKKVQALYGLDQIVVPSFDESCDRSLVDTKLSAVVPKSPILSDWDALLELMKKGYLSR
mgnify:CR=1 FL=1